MLWESWEKAPEWAKTLISRVSCTLEGMVWESLAECPSCEERVRKALEAIARVGDTVHEDARELYTDDLLTVCHYGRKE